MRQVLKTVVMLGIVVMFGAAVNAQQRSAPPAGRGGGTPPAGARPGGEGRTGGQKPANPPAGKPANPPKDKPATPPGGKKPAKPCKPTPTKPCK